MTLVGTEEVPLLDGVGALAEPSLFRRVTTQQIADSGGSESVPLMDGTGNLAVVSETRRATLDEVRSGGSSLVPLFDCAGPAPALIRRATMDEIAALGGGSYHADAAHFDGSSYVGTLSLSCADSRYLSVSFWSKLVLFENPTSPFVYISGVPSGYIALSYDSPNYARWIFENYIYIIKNSQVFKDGEWHHTVMCADIGPGSPNNTLQIYIDRELLFVGTVGGSPDPQQFVMNGMNFYVGGDTLGDNIVGDLAEFWFAPGQFVDFSQVTNLNKFIDTSGNPVFLGDSGELPTGTAPAIFLSGDSASFSTNKGVGGALSVTGSLSDASTHPTAVVDVTYPTIQSTNPANGASGVAVDVSPAATFSEDIQFGTGGIDLYDNDTFSESFNVATDVGTGPGKVSISGSVLTLHPSADFPSGTNMIVEIGINAIQNMDGYSFFGIQDETTWHFGTA